MSEIQFYVSPAGYFRRKSDARMVRRFRCRRCLRFFSTATTSPYFRQKKRQINARVILLLSSGVSQRRISKLLRISRRTVTKRLLFLGALAVLELDKQNKKIGNVSAFIFDDMESFEHTKLKPLSIPLAVTKSRHILGFEVASMPAKGPLAAFSRKKYGPRKDERKSARRRLFERIRPYVDPSPHIQSDEHPHYVLEVRQQFPGAIHERHKGQRGSIVGQGELKKIRFDPLFSLNHTCAMLRANINRLFRKTWCTTKKPERLALHIAIYAAYHNLVIIDDS